MSLLDEARNKKDQDFKPADVKFGGAEDKPGDGVEGKVLRISSKANKFKPSATDYIIALQLADGKEAVVFASRTVLRKEVAGLVQDGSLVEGSDFAAIYKGTEIVKSGPFAGTQTHVYRAVAKRPSLMNQIEKDDSLPF